MAVTSKVPVAFAAVSATTFAIYALAVSAAGAPPSVHAAGLVLWVAHVVLLFGRTPSQRASPDRRLGELRQPAALDRAADAAAGLSVDRSISRSRRSRCGDARASRRSSAAPG